MDILLGIFLIIFGLTITFMGTAVFFAVLPALGFALGFFTGAAGMLAIFGDGFLSTIGGWIAGFVIGLVFAFISYFWWYAGVLLSAGGLGALLGTGLAQVFGLDDGFLYFLFGLIGFIAFMGIALVLNIPIYVIIVASSLAGANLLVVGVLVLFNQIGSEDLGYGTASAVIDESWWWSLVVLVVAIVGASFQLSVRERLVVPQDKWVNASAVGGGQ
jgi:hypothetical protein